jgi:hypothetical protein
MGDLTFNAAVTEIQRRVPSLSTPDAGAAANRAVRWINRQGSFTFQAVPPTTLAVTAATGLATIPATMDTGKAHRFWNLNGMPIQRAGTQDGGWTSANFNLPATAGWNEYQITSANIVFYPAGASQPTSVNVVYHVKTADIAGGSTFNVPRDFDDLIVDLAEAEERRIFDVGDTWVQMLARVQDQIKVLLDGYRSVTQEPMPLTEAMSAVSEKLNIGRP